MNRNLLPLAVAGLALSSAGVVATAPDATNSLATAIRGRAVFEGTAPKAAPILMATDAVCRNSRTEPAYPETLVVSADGGLQNVFVYVKRGLDGRTFPAPTEPARIEQKGCQYTPHVLGLRAGQALEIINNDSTLHNIHAWPTKNTPFNLGQPRQGMRSTRTFEAPEVMVPLRCDVHSWMNGYVGVVDHPFFATTGAGGTFAIEALQPGYYVLEAWHEKLGVQSQKVTVTSDQGVEVQFVFKGRP